tara:strand:- start:1163 stop:1300 length:138 start_codon:yes stop_codon:yes gene_type:complete
MDLSDGDDLEGLTSSQLEKKIQALSRKQENKALEKAEQKEEPAEE